MEPISRPRANRASATELSLAEVEGLSVRHLAAGCEVYRCHSRFFKDASGNLREQGAWYFASASGRFDLPEPRGTLNVAAGTVGAVCESLGVLTLDREISIREIAARKLVALRTPGEVELVDFTDRKAAQAARILASEMTGAAPDYREFQSLAASVDQAGKDGICSRLRFSGPENEFGYFIFGESGSRQWPEGRELRMEAVVESLGYVIVDEERMSISEIDFTQ